jgi:hypothetical protein
LRFAIPLIAGTIAMVVGGCGSSPGPTASTHAAPSTGGPSSPVTPSITASDSPDASSRTATGLTVEVDPGLLAFIPGGGNGLDLTYDPDSTRQVASDPALARDAVGLAIALFTVTGASAPATDLAIVSVVQLRDPSIGEDEFRNWRDTYD